MSYTDDELMLLAAVPQLIGTAAASASPSGIIGTGKELFANASALVEGGRTYPHNTIIRQLVPDVAGDRGEAITRLQKVRDWIAAQLKAGGVDSTEKLKDVAIEKARAAADLLAAKASPDEAREYQQWTVSVADRVAQAATEGGFLGFGGERVTAEERAFIDRIKQAFDRKAAIASPLTGRKIVITAGPTYEPIGADHFIGRHDSGELGYKLAEAALALGSETVLISGPAHLPLPQGAQLMPVTTAVEMVSLCERELPCDIAACAAAMSRWRLNPGEGISDSPQTGSTLQLSLIETPDTAEFLATRRDKRPTLVVGFVTERENAVESGRAKFRQTKCDLIIVEDASPAAEDLFSDRATVHLVAGDKVVTWSRLDRGEIARRLMEALAARLGATRDLQGGL
jgi:phosphopantothenoylcysteine synthetase/decarboxylase